MIANAERTDKARRLPPYPAIILPFMKDYVLSKARYTVALLLKDGTRFTGHFDDQQEAWDYFYDIGDRQHPDVATCFVHDNHRPYITGESSLMAANIGNVPSLLRIYC